MTDGHEKKVILGAAELTIKKLIIIGLPILMT